MASLGSASVQPLVTPVLEQHCLGQGTSFLKHVLGLLSSDKCLTLQVHLPGADPGGMISQVSGARFIQGTLLFSLLLLLLSVFPSIRVFSNEAALRGR